MICKENSWHSWIYKRFYNTRILPTDWCTYIFEVAFAICLIVPFELITAPKHIFRFTDMKFDEYDSLSDVYFITLLHWIIISFFSAVSHFMFVAAMWEFGDIESMGGDVFIGLCSWVIAIVTVCVYFPRLWKRFMKTPRMVAFKKKNCPVITWENGTQDTNQ